jgi:magnesium-transporting ATPase (P-type)
MALQCLISSYSLSVLYLDGVKYGDTQMTAIGLLGSVSFMSVSRSKPLDKLSKVQPLNSIFHLASFTSLLGQFAIHLFVSIKFYFTLKSNNAYLNSSKINIYLFICARRRWWSPCNPPSPTYLPITNPN